MNLDFKQLIPKEMNPDSRVWIYQADRSFKEDEVHQLNEMLAEFNANWVSHGAKVNSYAGLLFNRFIVLMADESEIQVGGCSTDASANFIKKLEKDFDVSLFNRQSLAFVINDAIETISLDSVNTGLEDGIITGDSLYFNNTILTKKDMLDNWIIPMKKSWLSGRLKESRSLDSEE